MHEIVWRIGDQSTAHQPKPGDADAAQQILEQGNRDFVALLEAGRSTTLDISPEALGVGDSGQAPAQVPFGAVLACADARSPVELLFNQRANDLFVVRVAGGVLSEEALGSFDFAAANLPTTQLAVCMGHTGCGAVAAAAGVYLDPPSYQALSNGRPLLSLVQNLLGPVRLAEHTLEAVYGSEVRHRAGFRDALVEMSVVTNAGLVASALATRLQHSPAADRVRTTFAVYDLASRQVGLPGAATDWAAGLAPAPSASDDFEHALREMAFGPRIHALLDDEHGR